MKPYAIEKCDNCGNPETKHTVGAVRWCCECYVRAGYPPADWHYNCMRVFKELKNEKLMDNDHDNELLDRFIDQLKGERVEALMARHYDNCRLADYLGVPSLKVTSADLTILALEREKND